MGHLIADDARFILVVGNGTRSMHTGNTEIINRETPCSQSSAKRRNTFILTPEIVTPHVESRFELTLCFAFNVLCTITHVCIDIEVGLSGFHSGDFVLEETVLCFGPFFDLFATEVELAFAVLDIQQRRGEFRGCFACNSENT